LIYPDFARGSLDILGSLQAKAEDDYRDAEPGKIPHEIRYGELAYLKLIPHTPYYGTADATPLYLITLHATWRATGDKTLLERHLATAALALTIFALRSDFPSVSGAAVVQGAVGSVLGPSVAAISLGLVGHDALGERLGRNQRFASIGGLSAAAIMGAPLGMSPS
jgi:hypothetical protein